MHETSLIGALLSQVDRLLDEHGGGSVDEIRVEVGPLSGVEPLLLAAAFERLAPQSTAADARLVVDEVPLVAQCRACGRRSEVKSFRFRCRHCDSNELRVIQGDSLQLKSITIRQPDEVEGIKS